MSAKCLQRRVPGPGSLVRISRPEEKRRKVAGITRTCHLLRRRKIDPAVLFGCLGPDIRRTLTSSVVTTSRTISAEWLVLSSAFHEAEAVKELSPPSKFRSSRRRLFHLRLSKTSARLKPKNQHRPRKSIRAGTLRRANRLTKRPKRWKRWFSRSKTPCKWNKPLCPCTSIISRRLCSSTLHSTLSLLFQFRSALILPITT